MFCPFKVFNYEGRMYLFELFTESVLSFLMKPDFRHVFFIDQLTSLIGPLRDIEYTLCYYAYYDAPLTIKKIYCNNTRGIFLFIAFFPNVIRILQCMKIIIDTKNSTPQKYNIFKYCLNLLVATISFLLPSYRIFYPIWLVISFISTCYSFCWDIKMDFGFLQKGKNYPLRDKLYYTNHWMYYLAACINFILRYFWLLTLSPEVLMSLFRPETLSIILFSLEIFRRGTWNLLRVESKHIEISKAYKVANDIELPFVKQSGKYVINDTSIYDMLGMTREEKIKYELEKIAEESLG